VHIRAGLCNLIGLEAGTPSLRRLPPEQPSRVLGRAASVVERGWHQRYGELGQQKTSMRIPFGSKVKNA
jgi:hypothetical protein